MGYLSPIKTSFQLNFKDNKVKITLFSEIVVHFSFSFCLSWTPLLSPF